MSITTDWLSAAAAVVSSIGGSFAAYAAYRSAQSARDAQRAADEAERRATRREISSLASAIDTEVARIETLANQVKELYRTLFTLSSTGHNSRLGVYLDNLDQKIKEANSFKDDAFLFTEGARNLSGASPEGLEVVYVRLDSSYKRVFSLRQLIESELDEVSSQCAARRESIDRTRVAR
jgi:hypothetical protein